MESAEQQAGERVRKRAWLDHLDIPARPMNVDEALLALDRVAEKLAEDGDPRAAFPDIYSIITRRVGESVALGEGAFFLEPRWISRLAGSFCERYLETLRWSFHGRRQDTGAWGLAYEACDARGMLPIQHVLLGLSAHINFDLAMGIYRTIVEMGAQHDPEMLARFKHDHDAVNHLLRASIPEAFDHLISRHRCAGAALLFHHAYALSEWTAIHILSSWRDRVWYDAMALLHADAAGREEIVRRMELRSRRYAHLLAVPGVAMLPLSAMRSGSPSARKAAASRVPRKLLAALF
jgi:hypothetical protein